MTVDRREFLTYLGMGTLATLNNPLAAARDAKFPLARSKPKPPDFFEPIAPSFEDRLILPKGYSADLVIRWGDPLGSVGPEGAEHFGFNNDFTCWFPIDGLKGGSSSTEGILWVNHEYPDPLFLHGYSHEDYEEEVCKTAERIRIEKLSVGGSLVHLRRDAKGIWKPVLGSRYNRRYTASYPLIAMTGPTAVLVPEGLGTLANCSGGRTPWLTVLSCEENFPDYNLSDPEKGGCRWSDVPELALDERQYGWIVEVDPYGELPPLKHTALGRFKHENAAVRLGPTNRLVVYMGDDEADQCLYKFVSAEKFDKNASRATQRLLLTEGTLYAADFQKGKWLPLDLSRKESATALKKAGFTSQAQVLLETRKAAAAVKATPLDRCEDCEIHPLDGSVYVSLTNNTKHGNFYGQIVRVIEANDNPEGEEFAYEIFLAGGPQSGLACPDNLAFDKAGNLYVVCDMSSDKMGKGAYKSFGNNGMFVVPTDGLAAGIAYQFASGPVAAELTGPWFTEDEKTLFLSVQHPGETTKSLDKPTSNWPDGGSALPKPAVVAVRGF